MGSALNDPNRTAVTFHVPQICTVTMVTVGLLAKQPEAKARAVM